MSAIDARSRTTEIDIEAGSGEKIESKIKSLKKECPIVSGRALSNYAVIVLGTLGAVEKFPGSSSALGGAAVGLAASGYALYWASKRTEYDKPLVETFKTASLVTMGSLGCAQTLSVSQVGWSVLGSYVATIFLNRVDDCAKYFANRQVAQESAKHNAIILGIQTASLVTLMGLGSSDVLSLNQVVWGVAGTILAAVPVKWALSATSLFTRIVTKQ